MLNVITDNLDIWASAEMPAKKGGRGRAAATNKSPHGIQKLRELILELAVRGKLVPQDQNDEPAGELLKKIAAEKARLIKEKKIKKQKPLPELSDDDFPFELPAGWAAIRLGNLLERISNGFSGKQNKDGIGYPLSRIETISESSVNMGKIGFSPDLPVDKLDYFRLAENDILLSHINSDFHVGKTALVPADVELFHGVNLLLLRVLPDASPAFIDLAINALRLSGYFISIAQHAIGQSSVNQSKVVQIIIGLPPLAEQHRIVAKVDELMALCDQLEQEQTDNSDAHQTLVETLLATLTEAKDNEALEEAWQRIAGHFDILFTTEQSIDQLKQTILQLAVMGKLVPQDPNDEPASALLAKIAAEKSRLIKEKKIKKQKPLSEIGEDEKLFLLPQGWVWKRLGNVSDFVNGFAFKSSDFSDEGIGIVKIGDIQNGEITTASMSRVDESIVAGLDSSLTLTKGEMAIAMSGATTGKLGFNSLDEVFYLNQRVGKISPFLLVKEFIYYSLTTKISENLEKSMGSAIPNLSTAQIKDIVLAIPPLAEQQRIVAKVDELMALCDALKTRLNEAQTTQVQFADTIVDQAAI